MTAKYFLLLLLLLLPTRWHFHVIVKSTRLTANKRWTEVKESAKKWNWWHQIKRQEQGELMGRNIVSNTQNDSKEKRFSSSTNCRIVCRKSIKINYSTRGVVVALRKSEIFHPTNRLKASDEAGHIKCWTHGFSSCTDSVRIFQGDFKKLLRLSP